MSEAEIYKTDPCGPEDCILQGNESCNPVEHHLEINHYCLLSILGDHQAREELLRKINTWYGVEILKLPTDYRDCFAHFIQNFLVPYQLHVDDLRGRIMPPDTSEKRERLISICEYHRLFDQLIRLFSEENPKRVSQFLEALKQSYDHGHYGSKEAIELALKYCRKD